jgi:hypothetical protein
MSSVILSVIVPELAASRCYRLKAVVNRFAREAPKLEEVSDSWFKIGRRAKSRQWDSHSLRHPKFAVVFSHFRCEVISV